MILKSYLYTDACTQFIHYILVSDPDNFWKTKRVLRTELWLDIYFFHWVQVRNFHKNKPQYFNNTLQHENSYFPNKCEEWYFFTCKSHWMTENRLPYDQIIFSTTRHENKHTFSYFSSNLELFIIIYISSNCTICCNVQPSSVLVGVNWLFKVTLISDEITLVAMEKIWNITCRFLFIFEKCYFKKQKRMNMSWNMMVL